MASRRFQLAPVGFLGYTDAEMEPITPEQAGQLFPAECHFKIIAHNVSGVADRLNQILIEFQRVERVCPGNQSAGGKYLTYNVSLTIETRERMHELDRAFREAEGVRMVL